MSRILLVEDHPLVRRLGCEQLEALGYAVIGVEEAEAAQRLLMGDSTFDLVVTDWSLPGEMDGFRLAHWVREQNPDTPVLLVTGLPAAERMAHAANIPILLKPYTFDELEHQVRELL